MNSTLNPSPGRYDGHAAGAGPSESGSAADLIGTEFRDLFSDIQHLMQKLGNDVDPAIVQLRAKIESAMSATKDAFAKEQSRLTRHARNAVQGGDQYVRAQPWQAVGIAALAGLVVGIVVGRR